MEIGHYNNLIDWYNKELPKVIHKNKDDDKEKINHQMLSGDFCNSVYIFFNPITKLSKIGISDNPDRRKRGVETTSGMEVELLLLIDLEFGYDENRIIVEKLLHRFFAQKRNIGEWFNLTTRDLISIRNLFWDIEGDKIEDNLRTLKKYKSHA